MPWPVLRRAIELIADSNDPHPELVLYGGEPLMARELVERAVGLARTLEDRDRPLRIRLSTNGTLLDLDLVDLFDQNRVEVQLSFDGVSAAQNYRSPGTFEVLDRLLHVLKEKRPSFLRNRVRAAVTVSSAAVGYLASSVRYLSDLGVGEIGVTSLFSHDSGWTWESTETLDRELERIRSWCAWRLEETGQISFLPFRRYLDRSQEDPAKDGSICAVPGCSRLVVDVDGTLAPCLLVAPSITPPPPGPLAEALCRLDRGGVENPWHGPTVGRFETVCRSTGLFHGREHKYSLWGRCHDCVHRENCRPCPVATAWIPGNADPDRIPDHVCAFNRTLAAHRRRMPHTASGLELLRGEAPLPRALERLLARTSDRRDVALPGNRGDWPS